MPAPNLVSSFWRLAVLLLNSKRENVAVDANLSDVSNVAEERQMMKRKTGRQDRVGMLPAQADERIMGLRHERDHGSGDGHHISVSAHA